MLERELWIRFLKFIEYEYFNFYIREELYTKIKYSYITADKLDVNVIINILDKFDMVRI